METQVILKAEFEDSELVRGVKQMLSDDAPIFADELPDELQFMFDPLEDIEQPESAKFLKRSVQLEWIWGSNWPESLEQHMRCLDKARASK